MTSYDMPLRPTSGIGGKMPLRLRSPAVRLTNPQARTPRSLKSDRHSDYFHNFLH